MSDTTCKKCGKPMRFRASDVCQTCERELPAPTDMNQDQSKPDRAAPVNSTPLLVPHVIDGGCTTVQGLIDRCDCILKVHGAGSVTNDPRGIMYESEDGYRVLITLSGTNEKAQAPGAEQSKS